VGSYILLLAGALLIAPTAASEELTWTGCGITKKAFMSALSKGYEAQTGVKIVLSGGGATKGIREVSAGRSDLGGTCRHAIKDEREDNAKLVQVAWDALVAIIHPENKVNSITLQQFKDVINGKITNWSELGGDDQEIVFLQRIGKTNGVGMMTRELLFADRNHDYRQDGLVMKSSRPLELRVEKDPWSFGITGISSAKKRNVKILELNGKAPTYDNIANGKYMLYRPLYLAQHKNASEKVKAFIKYAKSKEGQTIIKNQGTVNMKDGKKLWKFYRRAQQRVRN